MVSEKMRTIILGFFETQLEKSFFEYILLEDDLKITNLYFEIPSEWARGKKEMVMLSVITEKEFNTESFYDLMKVASTRILTSVDIYKSLYVHDKIRELDEEITRKYEELRIIFLDSLKELEIKKKEIAIMELMASKDLSLGGAYKVFGTIMPDIISCILQEKKVILCGDKDASTALFNLLSRIFLEVLNINDIIVIKKECVDPNPEILIVNTNLGIIESGEVSDEAHNAINRSIQEAEKTGNNDAAIIFLRQKLSILLKVANLLERIITKKTPVKRVLKEINSQLRIKVKIEDLYAVRLILKAKGKEDVVDKIIVSKFDKF
jgi:hypothetical protein